MARGNTKNLKPRTQEGLQAALVASVSAWQKGTPQEEGMPAIRKAMMKHGYMAKVVRGEDKVIATSGTLSAEVAT
jgi:hypothetical protein